MRGFNKVILMGNLTRDPELKFIPSGKAVCKFGLAINRVWATESGEKKEEVIFIDCEAWGKSAENLAKYCKKGNPLFVEGRLKMDSWNDKTTNEKKTKLSVSIETFTLLGGGERTEKAKPHPNETNMSHPDGPLTAKNNNPEDDDVPF